MIWNPDDYSIEDLIVILTEKVGKRFVKPFGLAAEKKRKRKKKLKDILVLTFPV